MKDNIIGFYKKHDFWKSNWINIFIGIIGVIVPFIIFYTGNGLGAISLFAVFVAILSTLYSNYKSDMRYKFDKRNEVYYNLGLKLEKFMDILREHEDIHFVFFNYEIYLELSHILISFKYSFEFMYCSNDMKNIINEIVGEMEQIKFDLIIDEDIQYNVNFEEIFLPIINKLNTIWMIFDKEISSKN